MNGTVTDDYSKATYHTAGWPIPAVYGGFGLNFDCHGFDFAINFSYQIGGMAYDSGYAALMGSPYSGETGVNFHKDILKSWTAENPNSDIPRFQYGDIYANAASSRFMTFASYLNIENINAGYNLPAKWIKKVGLSGCRIYLACENVGYISARKGFDPRYSFSGATNYATYVPIRTISGGLTLKF